MSKKQKIEVTAKELFWKHGVKRVSIAEICEKAGVSRKTFYKHYDNKTDLALFLLDELYQGALTYMKGEIFFADIPFAEKIEKALKYKLEMAKARSKEFFDDILVIPEMRDYYMKMTKQSMELSRQFIISGQKSGEVNSELSIDYMLLLLQKYSEWLFEPQFRDFFPDVETLTQQVGLSFMYGIMPVPNNNNQ